MDIWEANSISNAFTPHPCDSPTPTVCSGNSCGGTYSEERYAGTCDPDGCDFNPFRMGNESFYGPGKIVDTNEKMTVVTQFLTDDGTTSGTLSEIKRFYVQNGKVIPESESNIKGVSGNSITTPFCEAQKEAFEDPTTFSNHGGMEAMSAGISEGMVLVMSLWDDYYARKSHLFLGGLGSADMNRYAVARQPLSHRCPAGEARRASRHLRHLVRSALCR